jgi:hypothetical protein
MTDARGNQKNYTPLVTINWAILPSNHLSNEHAFTSPPPVCKPAKPAFLACADCRLLCSRLISHFKVMGKTYIYAFRCMAAVSAGLQWWMDVIMRGIAAATLPLMLYYFSLSSFHIFINAALSLSLSLYIYIYIN